MVTSIFGTKKVRLCVNEPIWRRPSSLQKILLDDQFLVLDVQVRDNFESVRFVEKPGDKPSAFFIAFVRFEFDDVIDFDIHMNLVRHGNPNVHAFRNSAFQYGSAENQAFLIFTEESSFHVKFCHTVKS